MQSERTDARGVAGRREPDAGSRGGYAMWVAWIEAFRRGENRDTAGLPPIDGGMGSYVEARLLERLSGAFSERVRQWQTVLGAQIVAAPPTDDAAVSALLREAASGLEPLARVAGSPLLPRSMSLAMHDLLGQVRAGARDAVEESARRVREPEVEPRLPRVARRPANSPVPAQRTVGRNGRVADPSPGRSVTPAARPYGVPATPAPRTVR
ncbi:hypothetical protein [Actinomycetospora sp. TBRC 11914]|uniref:hypothetical protein n=1 Tax=Actinomycetospora sp. TBRC 11914 TaxID=2729387 RepID=UPI00145FC534|nr:hypothetical protein [Actinomycetospora sp. TBRC 11914]NMO92486.1 hypothetical protein [Actinomycetospora sp. TBRC 11914]